MRGWFKEAIVGGETPQPRKAGDLKWYDYLQRLLETVKDGELEVFFCGGNLNTTIGGSPARCTTPTEVKSSLVYLHTLT